MNLFRYELHNGGPGTVNVYGYPKGRRRFLSSVIARGRDRAVDPQLWLVPLNHGYKTCVTLRAAVRAVLGGVR